MNSVIVALTLAGAAAAQIVAGPVTMVPSSQIYATASAGDNHVAASSSSAPYGGATTQASSSSSAAASYYTQPPATDGGYSDMPYSSFMSGGYKSMNCGYGYSKGSDGSCNPMSWVSFAFIFWCGCLLTCCAPISTRIRDATRRSSSTSEYSLVLGVCGRSSCSHSGGSGYGGGYGYGGGCDSGSTKTVTMTDTMTVQSTVTMTDTMTVTQTMTDVSVCSAFAGIARVLTRSL